MAWARGGVVGANHNEAIDNRDCERSPRRGICDRCVQMPESVKSRKIQAVGLDGLRVSGSLPSRCDRSGEEKVQIKPTGEEKC